MGKLFTGKVGKLLTRLLGNYLTVALGKVLDIYSDENLPPHPPLSPMGGGEGEGRKEIPILSN